LDYALQLVRQWRSGKLLRRARESTRSLAVLHQSERDIFEYFAKKSCREPAEIQQYLMRIALLDRIEVDTCARLFPEVISSAVLPALVRGNVFMTVAGDGGGEEYRLHPLFQSFLRRRLRSEAGLAGVSAEHARFAQYFLERAAWEQAVRITGSRKI